MKVVAKVVIVVVVVYSNYSIYSYSIVVNVVVAMVLTTSDYWSSISRNSVNSSRVVLALVFVEVIEIVFVRGVVKALKQ